MTAKEEADLEIYETYRERLLAIREEERDNEYGIFQSMLIRYGMEKEWGVGRVLSAIGYWQNTDAMEFTKPTPPRFSVGELVDWREVKRGVPIVKVCKILAIVAARTNPDYRPYVTTHNLTTLKGKRKGETSFLVEDVEEVKTKKLKVKKGKNSSSSAGLPCLYWPNPEYLSKLLEKE